VRTAKKLVKKNMNHLCSWTVGSLTSKLRVLLDTVIKKRVNILCVQNIKWTGQKAKEVENTDFKL
jgi:exonuclease III